MKDNKDLTKIGIRILISQETDTHTHYLFEVFNVQSFDEKQFPKEYRKLLEKLKDSAIKLTRGKSE